MIRPSQNPPARPLAAALAVAVAVMALLAGCGGGGGSTASSEATHSKPQRPPRTRKLRPPQAHESRLPPSAAAGPCAGSTLGVQLGDSGAGLGTVYLEYEVTNRSGRACSLSGFPGVTAIGADGRQIGRPAHTSPIMSPSKHNPDKVVAIDRHHPAAFELSYGEAENYPARLCHPKLATHIRVTLPGVGGAHLLPLEFKRCTVSARGPGWSVGRLE